MGEFGQRHIKDQPMTTHDTSGVDKRNPAQRAQEDAAMLGAFEECVRQSQAMLIASGAPAPYAMNIAYARSMFGLPNWHVVACAIHGPTEPDIKQLAMIQVRDEQGQSSPTLAVFVTEAVAEAEIPRMNIPIEGGFWLTLRIPTEEVLPWIRSIKIQAISVVMQGGAAGPSRVLSVELLEKVQSIEAQAPRA
jgi:hypothetical protein